MNRPKVTAVVPVYNTEAYVEETLRSLTGQTLRELEILVINDGSTDRSLDVVERLAAEDGRIVVVSQPNKGLSEARNAGIDRAKGEFIHFMDSDDVLEADAYEHCYRRCSGEALDFAFFDARSFGTGEPDAPWFDYHRVGAVGEEVRPGAQQLERMFAARCYRASACLSFIRTDFLRTLGLRFHPGILHEDELFTPQLYLGAQRTAGIARDFFLRRVRPGSIMGSRFSQRSLDGYMTVLDQLQRCGADRGGASQHIVDYLTGYTLRGVTFHASTLPFSTRMRLARKLLRRYPRHVTCKQIAHLLLRTPVKKILGR